MVNRRGKVEEMTDFIYLGSKITGDSDCCREMRRHLLLGRKAMTNPDSILKSKDITLQTKVHIALLMVQLSHLYMTTGKTIALTRWIFLAK